MTETIRRRGTRVANYRLPVSDPLPAADSVQGYNAYMWESFRLAWFGILDWFDNHIRRR